MFSESKWFNPGGAAFDTTLIGNSVWLDGSADFLTAELGAKTRTRAVIGTWMQKNDFTSSDQTIFSKNRPASLLSFAIRMQDQSGKDGLISIFDYDGSGFQYVAESSGMVLRDIGWYHIMLSIDTTATAGSRLLYFINGIDLTSTLTVTTDYAENDNPSITNGSGQGTQWGVGTTGASQFNSAYYAQSFMLDDDSIQNSDVAVSDILDTFTFGTNGSQFVPKANADIAALASSAGGSSFCLDYADSSALGTDASSLGNDFTPTSMAAANQSTSTPSLVYPSLTNIIPASESGQGMSTLTNGNLSVAAQTGRFARSAMIVNSTFSKLYYEVTFDTVDATYDYPRVGIALTSYTGNDLWAPGEASGQGYGLRANTSTIHLNGSNLGTNAGFSSGDVYMCAFDPATGKIWAGKDGTFFNSGDPAGGSGEVATITGDEWKIFVGGVALSGSAYSVNFGQSAFAHTVPTGFASLASSNLPAPDAQGVDHFVTTLAQEGSLLSAMGTAESAFSGYLRFYKSRASASASETWGYSFSHDSSNEYILPTANTAMTYGSIRSLSGTDNWVGYSLDISSSAGTAAGSQAHSNGSDTTVTHSLGSSRYIVLLFNRSGGDIFYYHPDVAAGSLLKFNSSVLPFSSTVITDITTNSFDIGSAAASATYDYLVIAETPGMTDVFSYTGNSSTNGPYLNLNAQPEFWTSKLTTTHATEHVVLDQTRSPINDADIPYLLPNHLNAEANNTTFVTDFLSTAVKLRNASTDLNFSGGTFVGWAFGKIAGGGTLPPVYGK